MPGLAEPISARAWIDLLFDPGSFDEEFGGILTPDRERAADARRRTGGGAEAVVAGTALLGGDGVVVAVSDVEVMDGSMGYVAGERAAHAMDRAREAGWPFVFVTCSGGARVREGVVALLQMAKTAAAAARLHEAGVAMIGVLAHPTTGGVLASYATRADVLVAEERARIGFGQPPTPQDGDEERDAPCAEELLAHGLVDAALPRDALRAYLIRVVGLLRAPVPHELKIPPPGVDRQTLRSGWDVVQLARHPQRPRALSYIGRLSSEFVPLRGDRAGRDDPALIGGLARFHGTNCVVIGQERGDTDPEGARHNGRVGAAGYRKARRLMLLADRLQLPLVTFIDTPGAHDGIADEASGLAGAISDCLATMAALTTPSVSVVIGEGGSGGALALTVADRILMQQNAMYAITSPEGAAAILYRDRSRAPDVAEALGVSARDLLALGAIDRIVPEPPGGAHLDPGGAVRLLGQALRSGLAEAMEGKGAARRRQREERVRQIGRQRVTAHEVMRHVGGFLGDALGVAGHLGQRLRRRGEDAVLPGGKTAVAHE